MLYNRAKGYMMVSLRRNGMYQMSEPLIQVHGIVEREICLEKLCSQIHISF